MECNVQEILQLMDQKIDISNKAIKDADVIFVNIANILKEHFNAKIEVDLPENTSCLSLYIHGKGTAMNLLKCRLTHENFFTISYGFKGLICNVSLKELESAIYGVLISDSVVDIIRRFENKENKNEN